MFAFDSLCLNSISLYILHCFTLLKSYTYLVLFVFPHLCSTKRAFKTPQLLVQRIQRSSYRVLHGKFRLTLGYILCVSVKVLNPHYLSYRCYHTYSPPQVYFQLVSELALLIFSLTTQESDLHLLVFIFILHTFIHCTHELSCITHI